jgi:hypothetical protein
MKSLSEAMKHFLDFLAAVGAVAGFVFTTVIPALASMAALTWYGIRFYYFLKEKKLD